MKASALPRPVEFLLGSALPALLAVILTGCSTPARPQTAAGATPLGAPRSAVRPEIIERIDSAATEPVPLRLPEQITLPATYRLLLIDGHLALVRENEGAVVPTGPTSLRIVAGEIARGELAYQPALLPQELAAELAAGRESAARMDRALAGVMQRSRELAAQAERLEAQTRTLDTLFSAGSGGRPAPPSNRPDAGPIAAEPSPPGK